MKKIFLVSFCLAEDIKYLKEKFEPEDMLVGVDQGTKMLLDNELIPDFIIGDFDSFQSNYTFPAGTKVIALPTEKDESDLEYALNYFLDSGWAQDESSVGKPIGRLVVREKPIGRLAVREKPIGRLAVRENECRIIIINNMQGRTDHALSALFLLEKAKNISIENASQQIYRIDHNFRLECPIESTVSLIPISDEVTNVSTSGLYYTLQDETLYRSESRGLSNISIDDSIEIDFLNGDLLCIVNRRD